MPLDAAERVIDVPQGDEAEMAGFSVHRELTERAIRDVPGGAVTAMRYLTPDQGQIHKRLTPRQKEWAFRRGWKVSAPCRPESGFAAVGVGIGLSARRFDAGLRPTRDGAELIATQRIRTGWDGIRRAVSLPPTLRLEVAIPPAPARPRPWTARLSSATSPATRSTATTSASSSRSALSTARWRRLSSAAFTSRFPGSAKAATT
jgi:hypothetical protein